VLINDGLTVDQVREALTRGAEDVLRTPLDAGDVLARAHSAARTKALVDELTAQNRRLESLLLFDELTGLRNRRALLNELEMLIAAARRHTRPLALLMLDIDSFKPINDRYGHAVGDEVLREMGRRLRGRVRTEDVAGRLGGDELLVVLPDTDAEGAAVLAGSICKAIRAELFHTSAGLIRVTASIGSATWGGEPTAGLLEAADQALYRAKGAGRDRVS
jgi:diguanylate cyclase (GGDEF)-like protein